MDRVTDVPALNTLGRVFRGRGTNALVVREASEDYRREDRPSYVPGGPLTGQFPMKRFSRIVLEQKLLGLIRKAETPPSQRELARLCGCTQQWVSLVLRGMAEDGLVVLTEGARNVRLP